MFKLLRRRPSQAMPHRTAKPLPLAEKLVSTFERHRLADTDGTRRRMLQTIESNRLL